MNFHRTINFIYKNCINRVKDRLEELKLPQISICPSDKSLVSHFFNYEKYKDYEKNKKQSKSPKNNPYLITPKLLNSVDKYSDMPCGIVPILGFKDEHEALWGTDEEFDKNLHQIFRNMIFDLLDTNNEKIEYVLCDYVPYAKYSTYLSIFHETKDKFNLPFLTYYGITEDDMFFNIDKVEINAIDFLYSKPKFKEEFNEIFSEFTQGTLTYTKIDKAISNNFVQPRLIPLLKKYAPSGDSLGLRVKNIIENDLSQSKDLILAHEENHTLPNSEYKKALINASSSYIVKLEEIQKLFMHTS